MKKIITFGEVLERESGLNGQALEQTNLREVYYGGSEANVAVALARYGLSVAHVTALPENGLGKIVRNTLAFHGVDTSFIKFGAGRLGRYLINPGCDPCSTKCEYDRQYSVMSLMNAYRYNWKEIFSGAGWFHFSGITPALSEECAKACRNACVTAKKMGLTVSCDINYRSKLWSMKEAAAVMQDLCQYVDIVFINEDEAHILGFEISKEELLNVSAFSDMVAKLTEKYPFKIVASAARINNKTAVQGIVSASGISLSGAFPINVVDPIGAGDAFAAALIYGYLSGMDQERLIDFSAAACALKHRCKGDCNLMSLADIEKQLSERKQDVER